MNRDQVKGFLGELKGRAKLLWGDVTDDPDTRVEGAGDKFLGRVQRRFGDSKEELKRALDRIRLP